MSAGDDRPVCVVKRFRKSPHDPGVSAHEPMTAHPAASPRTLRSDVGTPEGFDSEAWSVISPVDLFGAADDAEPFDDSQTEACQPRWNALGEYDFGYQAGNPLDLRPAARRPQFGQPESNSWVPPSLSPRQFHHPEFCKVSTWRPPVLSRKSRVQLGARPSLGPKMHLRQPLPHVATQRRVCPDAPLVRTRPGPAVAVGPMASMQHACTLHVKSRRIWLGIQIPGSSKRKLLDTTHEPLQAWKDILTGTPCLYDMLPPPYFPALASADACATQHEAGLGGLLRINGQVVAWYAFQISFQEAQAHVSWLSDSMQKHINVWELLGQYCLAYCLDRFLHGRNHGVAAIFACDNTSAEAAHLKALSTSPGMCHILAAFFRFQRIHNLHISIQHFPGVWNHDADALSRNREVPDCTPDLCVDIPWKWLTSSLPSWSPDRANFPRTLIAPFARVKINVSHRVHFGVLVSWRSMFSISFGVKTPFIPFLFC